MARMWPFSSTKSLRQPIEEVAKIETPIMDKWKRKEAERDEFVRDNLPKMIAGIRDDDLKNVLAITREWEEDKTSYFLKPVRHGDFLSLFITRQIKTDDIGRIVTSVNLSHVKRVDLVAGHDPDSKGEAMFSYCGRQTWMSSPDDPPFATALVPFKAFSGRNLIEGPGMGDPEAGIDDLYSRARYKLYGMGDRDPSIDETVKGLARHAQSDRIHFVGTDTVIPVPFGLGQMIYSAIMDELQRGYIPPTATAPMLGVDS